MPQIIFIKEENKAQYKQALLDFIQADFEKRVNPAPHFWHNKDDIASACDESRAMIVLNTSNEIIGYMTWVCGAIAEIGIVEVREDCRRRGIFKSMLSAFLEKFSDTFILSASVLPQAEKVFSHLGWANISRPQRLTKFFKVIKPILEHLNALPEGRVIAVCPNEFYQVQRNPDKHKHLMQYFPIELDAERKLHKPLITSFHHDGYLGVYHNKELIAEGKAKYLFGRSVYNGVFLVIDRFNPIDQRLFDEKGFFSQSQQASRALENDCHPMDCDPSEAEAAIHHTLLRPLSGKRTLPIEFIDTSEAQQPREKKSKPTVLVDLTEDETDEPIKLTLDLVPNPVNLRAQLSRARWRTLRARCLKETDNKCAICCKDGKQNKLTLQALWKYDDVKKIQRLSGLIPLCFQCHATQHMGKNKGMGSYHQSLAHLAHINQWSLAQAENHVEQSFSTWEARCKHSWQLDFSWFYLQGKPLKQKTTQKSLPLKKAVQENDLETVHILLTKHLLIIEDVVLEDSRGNTILHYAIMGKQDEMLEALLKYPQVKSFINTPNQAGITPVLRAIKVKQKKMIQLLIAHYADLSKTTSRNQNVLHYAAYTKDTDIITLLLNQKTEPLTHALSFD